MMVFSQTMKASNPQFGAQNNMYSEEVRSLFLGDLSCFCEERHIFELFASCGAIEGIRLMRSKTTNRCLGYGFITFCDLNSFGRAVQFHRKLFMGRRIKIGLANSKVNHPMIASILNYLQEVDPSRSLHRHSKLMIAQVHYSFLTHNIQDLITEETLLSLFSQFGEVEDVTIKKSLIDPRSHTQSGYGFIHYPLTDAGISAAVRAASVCKQVMIGNVLYDSRLTRSVEEMCYCKDRMMDAKQMSVISSTAIPRPAVHRPVEPVFTTYGTPSSSSSSPTTSKSGSEAEELVLESLGLY